MGIYEKDFNDKSRQLTKDMYSYSKLGIQLMMTCFNIVIRFI